jgi:hypothetical protein
MLRVAMCQVGVKSDRHGTMPSLPGHPIIRGRFAKGQDSESATTVLNAPFPSRILRAASGISWSDHGRKP